jgi:hypothetical protein
MKKRWWFGAIALGILLLLTLVFAPSSNKLNSGSTYNRSPDGYGAWYAFMEKRGISVQRWQKPFDKLPITTSSSDRNPIAFLRVHSALNRERLSDRERDWVKPGNTLIVLGVQQPVTPADFSTWQASEAGKVKIDTRRRLKESLATEKQLLGDRFGAVVWQRQLGEGKVIFATTPHLAANAYQDELGNYEFLAQLVTVGEEGEREKEREREGEKKKINRVFVDEYIHGYKDRETIAQEGKQNWVSYLSQTPILAAMLQAGVILTILVWAQNRRLGLPVNLKTPVVDNTEAYIQALADVLQKAESAEFVVDVVGKEQQLQLQKALGLGANLLDRETLVEAWVRHTGLPATELQQLLQFPDRKRRIDEKDLLSWLGKWQRIMNLKCNSRRLG